MKAILLSIRPKWCELIASGRKTIEVRKTRPKLEAPFKVYIYCSKGNVNALPGKQKVVGEFVCEHIYQYSTTNQSGQDISRQEMEQQSCLTYWQLSEYEISTDAKDGCLYLIGLYGWNISNLKIYARPRELSEFCGLRKTKFGMEPVKITRPPQSWCYVEEAPTCSK